MSEPAAPPRAPSIRDVATAAGVSHQTVSRVLNGSGGIRPATEQRVRRAIDALGWRPSRAARSLATARHLTVGVLNTARGLYGPLRAGLGLEEAARERGYGYTSAAVVGEGPAALAEAYRSLVGHGVDGLVLSAPQEWAQEALRDLAPALPTVSLSVGCIGRVVAFDQVGGARRAVAHLAGLGHRRIAVLPGPTGWTEADQRLEGWLDEAARRGLEVEVLPCGDWSSDAGHAVARAWLPRRRSTAVLCANDETALGLLHAAHEAGAAVPGDLSVVGFDDVAEARHLLPPLTTVRQDFVALGRQAMGALIDELAGRGHAPGPALDLELVERASTGPVPSA